MLTRPRALEGTVGKIKNGTMYYFYLLHLAGYCKKEMTQKKELAGLQTKRNREHSQNWELPRLEKEVASLS